MMGVYKIHQHTSMGGVTKNMRWIFKRKMFMNTIGRVLGQIEFFKHCKDVVKSLGVVFGDIGTSPIYTLSVIFLLIRPVQNNVIGVLSLIIWTLVVLVT